MQTEPEVTRQNQSENLYGKIRHLICWQLTLSPVKMNKFLLPNHRGKSDQLNIFYVSTSTSGATYTQITTEYNNYDKLPDLLVSSAVDFSFVFYFILTLNIEIFVNCCTFYVNFL